MLKFEWFEEAMKVVEAFVNNEYKVTIRKEKGKEEIDDYYIVDWEEKQNEGNTCG